jgi:hypothetical protein
MKLDLPLIWKIIPACTREAGNSTQHRLEAIQDYRSTAREQSRCQADLFSRVDGNYVPNREETRTCEKYLGAVIGSLHEGKGHTVLQR